jgi:hypothetical protein
MRQTAESLKTSLGTIRNYVKSGKLLSPFGGAKGRHRGKYLNTTE